MSTNTQRLNKLRNYKLLDTEAEAEFDSITQIAAYICDAPISLVTLIEDERMWFKSSRGLGDLKQVATNDSFCVHAINSDSGEMVINDLREDDRFVANPFVCNAPNAQFYAGISITTPDGHRLGTVCVLDNKPRELTDEQIECLRVLSDYTIKLIELRYTNTELEDKKLALQNLNQDLEQYAYAIAHDIKAPLRIMSSFTSILKKSAKDKLTKEEHEFFDYIENSAKELGRYTQNLLHFSKSIQLDTHSCSDVNLSVLLESLNNLLNKDKKVFFFFDDNLPTIFTSEVGLRQILQNLISNSIRYRDEEAPTSYVGIEVIENENDYTFKVMDNGIGISGKQMSNIFQLFTRNKMNKESTGIGLNVVKRLVEKMNGKIDVQSKKGKGTTVEFSIERILKS